MEWWRLDSDRTALERPLAMGTNAYTMQTTIAVFTKSSISVSVIFVSSMTSHIIMYINRFFYADAFGERESAGEWVAVSRRHSHWPISLFDSIDLVVDCGCGNEPNGVSHAVEVRRNTQKTMDFLRFANNNREKASFGDRLIECMTKDLSGHCWRHLYLQMLADNCDAKLILSSDGKIIIK